MVTSLGVHWNLQYRHFTSFYTIAPSMLFFTNIPNIHTSTRYGGFLKWWYPTTMVFPTKNDHFGVFWGYPYFWKHLYVVSHPCLHMFATPPTITGSFQVLAAIVISSVSGRRNSVQHFGTYLGLPWVYPDIPAHVSGGYDFDLISIAVCPVSAFLHIVCFVFFVEQRTYLYDWSYLIWYFILLLKCTVDGVDRSYAPRVSSIAIASLNFPQTSIPLKQHPLLKVYFS